MTQLLSEPTKAMSVTSIEGVPAFGTFFVTPMLEGARMSMLQVRLERGARSATHVHSHESLIYVVSGALKTVVGDREFVVRQGEACRHPEYVSHSVEALEDTLFVEVKAPVPELRATFGG